MKDINLITLYYTDIHSQHQPVNFRVYDKREGKTRNDYVQEMLKELLAWGLEPTFVTGDSWYSCVANLKLIKNHQVETPEEGLGVWLKQFGLVKLFRTRLKDQLRHYVVYLLNDEPLDSFERTAFCKLHDQHWMIEQYHRTLK